MAFGANVLSVTLLCAPGAGATTVARADLADLSLEELSNIEITSVSKRAERLSDAPASVFVITADDIRRSGATSLPELLRLAPNLQVSQTSASGYVITARGFASASANKLLVLIDGRSVYTPLFSGVFWDAQDVVLQDLERIEVVSGAGGTLWGSNAVNGVINIITRSANDTQGTLLSAGAGNRVADVALRHGTTIGDGNVRLYAKHFDRKRTKTFDGGARDDAWSKSQAGFRADWGGARDQFTAQGNIYSGDEGQPRPGTFVVSGVPLALDDISLSGVNLLTRWTRQLDGGSALMLQAYYDRTDRTVPPTFAERLDVFDAQFQYSSSPNNTHALVWGAEYRENRDRVNNSNVVAFLPATLNQRWASLFAQDEISLRDDLRLTLGARAERNDYTGTEFLPNARLAWKVAADHLLWTAASRTVRAPSRLDRDVFVYRTPSTPGPGPFVLIGGPNVRSEIAKVYELGYRGQPTPRTSYSVTAFHADYDHLRTQEFTVNPLFVYYANEMEGKSNGVEMWGSYQASQTWRLSGGFTRLNRTLNLKPGSVDQTSLTTVGMDPKQVWTLRSSHDLGRNMEFDVAVRGVSALSNPTVPGYTVVDMRLGWQASKALQLSVSARNLGERHAEFGPLATRSEIGPGVYFNVEGRF